MSDSVNAGATQAKGSSEQSASEEATYDIVVEDARVVTPDDVVSGSVAVKDGRIEAVESGSLDGDATTRVDAAGRVLMPGIVDLHGDDIEKHLHPRSNAAVEPPMALASADRANISSGITTKFHAIAFEHNPEKDRSPELAMDLVESIRATDSLLADHRIHARCEITDAPCIDAVETVLANDAASLVSVMSHVPGKGQFRDIDRFREYYENDGSLSVEEAEALIEERTSLTEAELSERIDRIVSAAEAADVVVASHDDETVVEVERLNERGIGISEYPITIEAAQRASDLGMFTAMGAPNLVRGGSQWGNLATEEAIDADAVDALLADYHPPSLLAAPFVETGESLSTRVARVTKNPADAVGLTDRGRVEVGARADVVLVEPDPTPVVERAIVAGELVYKAEAPR
ncbi:alpha-D-ribose 1-methylphosphonate 5-triphosphate diphosphatase [Halogeometricum borinquense]|uniref:Alpha-D-ribose 1-methylphosphonate 5-triphosphate diphosphatase n=1 Tax=Halogeometricum borinquense TaxID=60847 RepID=A0A6C0UGD8_9EURY|nr:alpha-D-ribose 1-methylphosphonate 5-triphosphate diphosphatase [Halogeometricum borinquense]QIB74267.1 alpha-D-ribose 1-methylphosphonate 5-triphosphate diphosphatase [Halogeometricum borinquense]